MEGFVKDWIVEPHIPENREEFGFLTMEGLGLWFAIMAFTSKGRIPKHIGVMGLIAAMIGYTANKL